MMDGVHENAEYLDTLGLVKSYFFKFFQEKKSEKNRKKKCLGAQTPQRMRRFPCLQDCLLTLTCHLATTVSVGASI
jgi:flavin reductase (DIM6/NTAB) family NADH-FMN oxidoreductase RutF